MRVGLKSETGRVITARGVKPIAQVQWQQDNFWIYGVVEPLNGWHFEQEYSHLIAFCLQMNGTFISESLVVRHI